MEFEEFEKEFEDWFKSNGWTDASRKKATEINQVSDQLIEKISELSILWFLGDKKEPVSDYIHNNIK